tara:strand:- start:57 stop:749 length:693 start_codon:yes stop_codon:yes gene_type:complete
MYTLDVIVPFFNEEVFLKESVGRLLKTSIHTNIYLVDNNSDDNSPEIAKKLSKDREDVHYVKTPEVSGKGFGIQTVMPYLKSSHVVIHDADLEYFPEDIIEMFDLAKQNQKSLILGSRFIGSKIRQNIYLRTFIANRVMSLFFSLVNFYRISDVASCYKLMPVEFLKNIDLKEKGFSIEIELLSKFLKFNRSVLEVPISYEGRSYADGKKIKATDGLQYLFNTIKYRFIN